MKKLFFVLFAALTAGALLAGSHGCSSTCDTLKDVCKRCTDADYRASCEATVDEGDSAVCNGRIGTYQQFCPGGEGGFGGGGAGGPGCAPGEALCDGSCVDILNNLDHCGSCGNACDAANPFCVGGACTDECNLPFSDCGGACVDTQTNAGHCGSCGNACDPGDFCSEGSCVPMCDESATSTAPNVCGQSCVNLASDLLHCGTCGNACAPGQVCSNGTCANGCGVGLTECCGKCADTASSGDHCGGCDEGCDGMVDPPMMGTGGGGGAGGGEPETHSGPCAPPDPICDDGLCVSDCMAPEEQCGNGCVDTNSNAAHCGGCNNVCPSGSSCANGTCSTAGCPSGTTLCAGSCVDLGKSKQHCGACGHACASNEVCSLGSCSLACTQGLKACNGGCIDTASNPAHCGDCGNACPASAPACQGSVCVSACDTSAFTDCGNGQCVNTASMQGSNVLHCGGCNNGCGDNNACTADSCNSGQCANVSGGVICNDGNPCTQDTCDPITKCKYEAYSQPDFEALCAQLDGMNPALGCIWCDPFAEGSPCQQGFPDTGVCRPDPPATKSLSGCLTCLDTDGAGGNNPICNGVPQACPPPP